MGWTDERIALLTKLWPEGIAASAIAERLGSGFTRNSVIGKAHRLGLATSPRSTRKATRPPRKLFPRTRAMVKVASQSRIPLKGCPLPPPSEADIPRVATIDLDQVAVVIAGSDGVVRISRQHCRWPCVDDPKTVSPAEKQFCGDQKVPGQSYCAAHLHRSANDVVPINRFKEPVLPRDLANPAVWRRPAFAF